MGFDVTLSEHNYRKQTDIGLKKPDLHELADFMLTALHDGYGARTDSEISAVAPLAPPPYAKCQPLS